MTEQLVPTSAEAELVRSVSPALMARELIEAGNKVTALDAALRAAEAKVAAYENATTWNTTCLSCSVILDRSYGETCRREEAEEKLGRIAACTREWKLLVGDDPEALADAILAIIGSEEEQP